MRDHRIDKETWSKGVVQINGPEDLREALRGSDIENVQLKPGKMQGSIAHFGVGNLGISIGRFNSGVRMRGALHQERVVVGTLLERADRVTHWW